MTWPLDPKTLAAAVALALLWAGEAWAPFFPFGQGKRRLRHDAKNLFVGLFNATLVGLFAAATLGLVDEYAAERGWGLLRSLAWPVWLEALLAFLLLDLWMYLWHRANHAIPFLWRFHRMHHSDKEMDATTGLRFHTGEVLMSAAARLVVLPLIGMTLWQVVLYEAVFLPVVLAHHSNVRLPRWLDYGLLAVVVTPAMHRVHHSRWRPETDSNYGSVFPFWDRLLGTFRLRGDARGIELGLDELDEEGDQTLWGMLKTPLRGVSRSRPNAPRSSRRRDASEQTRRLRSAG